jgi:hypothetical protein
MIMPEMLMEMESSFNLLYNPAGPIIDHEEAMRLASTLFTKESR